MNEGRADENLLAHAVRITLDELVLPRRELKELQEAIRTCLDLVAFPAPQSRHEPQEFTPGELLVQERPIGDVSHAGLRGLGVLIQVSSTHEDLATGRPENTGNHTNRCRLPGSVGAEEAKDLTTRHGQVQ